MQPEEATVDSWQLRVLGAPGVADMVRRCACDDTDIPDREGRLGRGFTNLKRLLGYPDDFARVVDELADTVPSGQPVAGCDEGSWALAGAVALRLRVPVLLIRRTPKTYFVSYGTDPTAADGRLAGERLPPATQVHLLDYLVYSGDTLRSAVEVLRSVGLGATSASAILWTIRADAAVPALSSAGLQSVTCLVSQADMAPSRP
jgi:adenine/guanine phosphoribosyltransferase-like PRPP-binding protein